MPTALPTVLALAALAAGPKPLTPLWSDVPARAALADARLQNRPVVLEFFTTWCLPCKEMDRVTFGDLAVREVLAGHVALRVDAESGEGAPLAESYAVFGYPTVILLGPDGKELGRMVGFTPPEEFVRTARGFLDAANPRLSSAQPADR